jgi:hypothetical protein
MKSLLKSTIAVSIVSFSMNSFAVCPRTSEEINEQSDRTLAEVRVCVLKNKAKIIQKAIDGCMGHSSGNCQGLQATGANIKIYSVLHDHMVKKLAEKTRGFLGRRTVRQKDLLTSIKQNGKNPVQINQGNVEELTGNPNLIEYIVDRSQKMNLVDCSDYPSNSMGAYMCQQDASSAIENEATRKFNEYTRILRRQGSIAQMSDEAINRTYITPEYVKLERALVGVLNQN